MLQNGFNETKVNGNYAFRFRIEDITDGEKYSFQALWEQGAKFHLLEKKGHELNATAWDKDFNRWENNNVEARATGIKRAESAARSKGKEVPATEKPASPGLNANKVAAIKEHSVLTDLIARTAKKEGISDETRTDLGMKTMELLTHVGFTLADIKNLVKQYAASAGYSEVKNTGE